MRVQWLLALIATPLSSCYTVACVGPEPALLDEIRRERLESVFEDTSGIGPLACQGEEAVGGCASQGFTCSATPTG